MLVVFSITFYLLSGCSIVDKNFLNQGIKWVIFLGLNDKDDYIQKMSIEESEDIASDIILKYADGYTKLNGEGAFKNDKNIVTTENSLIYHIYFASKDDISKIMDELMEVFNQESILVEKYKVDYDFYSK
ncbi:MAG: DUF3574 domain-containing protein [Oscillospiraceae bacterium]|nr:DUF3574 domain-containing protein [Oscillospiraceae bacterium]